MQTEDFTKSIACLLAWREERGNQTNGMLGVLFVLRNRIKAGWFGGDWIRNMAVHGQFSSMTVKGDSQTVEYPDPRDPTFQQLLNYIDHIYDDTMPDTLTNGALYYADLSSPSYDKEGWFARVIVGQPGKHPRCATIGTTTYFK